MSENKRFKPKKASLKRIAIAFILIIAVVAGIYALVTKNDDQANEQDDVKVHSEENEQPKKTDDSKKETPEAGTVTKETSNSTEGKSAEEQVGQEIIAEDAKTNKEDTTLTMPKYNKDAIIANAKAQVYTVYTDLQQGSGFLVNRKGDILTNAHVAKDAGFVVVKNEHGQEFQGKVIGISEDTDVALVRVPDLASKDPLVLDVTTASVGTKVVAIGSPKDQYGTTTEGVIQSIGAEFIDEYTYSNLYEITAKLNRGSSGGPLINAETGNVIGINSIILEDHPDIGYAIPLASVMGIVNEWAAQDIKITFEEFDEEFNNNYAEEAYFDEELISENMVGFYELIKQTILSGKNHYYESYIVSGSEAMNKTKALIKNYTKNKEYKSLTYDITNITIGEEQSTIDVSSVLTYVDSKTKETHTITDQTTYTIVIDEYGQYMISEMVINSTVDTGAVVKEEKPVVEEKPAVDDSTTTPEKPTTTPETPVEEEEVDPNAPVDENQDVETDESQPVDPVEPAELLEVPEDEAPAVLETGKTPIAPSTVTE